MGKETSYVVMEAMVDEGLIGWEAELSLLLDRSWAPHGADSAFEECVQSDGY